MKKIALIAAALLFVLFFTNTALAKYVRSHYNSNTPAVGVTDVKIVSKSITFNSCDKKTVEFINAVSSVQENLENIKPGDKIVISYKIVNTGDIDVILDGVNITMHRDELEDKLKITWRLVQYYDDQPVNSIKCCANAQSFADTSAFIDTSSSEVSLYKDNPDSRYCMLHIVIFFDDEDTIPCEIPAETSFTISPSFRQK